MRFEDSVAYEWLQLAERADIVIDEDDIRREALDNMWVFSPRDDQLGRIDTDTLIRFVDEIIRDRLAALAGNARQGMIFYCWHDRQARQLRFSLVSSAHGRLPFACEIEVTDMAGVVGSIVQDDWLNPNWGQDDGSDAKPRLPLALPVFVHELKF